MKEEYLSTIVATSLEHSGKILTQLSYILGYIKAHRLWSATDTSFEAYLQRKGFKHMLRDIIHGLEGMQSATPRTVSYLAALLIRVPIPDS